MNELNSTKKLNELIMGMDNKKMNKNKNKNNCKISEDIKVFPYSISNKNIYGNGSLNKLDVKNNKKDISNNLEDSSKLYCVPNLKKKELSTSKKSLNSFGLALKNKLNNQNISISVDSNKNQNNNIDDMEKNNFPLSYYFLGFFLIKIRSKKFKEYFMSEKFAKSFMFYTRIIDISTFITLSKQFEAFKKVVINLQKANENQLVKRRDSMFLGNNRLPNIDKFVYKDIKKMKSITLINKK